MFRKSLLNLSFSASFAALTAAGAFAADVKIDKLEFDSRDGKQTVAIKNLEILNTNLSREEVIAILTAKEPDKKQALGLAAKAKFDRFSVPEVVISGKADEPGQLTIRDYVVVKYDQGKFERAAIGSFEGRFAQKANAGDVFLKSGSIEALNGDFSKPLANAAAGETDKLGNGRLDKFSWSDFQVRFPEKAASGTVHHSVLIGSINLESKYDGELPTRGTGSVKDIVFTPGAGSSAAQTLSTFGYQKVQLSLNIDGDYDAAKTSFKLTDFSLSGPASGTLALSGFFGNIGPDAFRGETGLARIGSLLQGNVSNLALDYKDSGLFEKALVFYANMSGKEPQAVRMEWAGAVAGLLPMLAGGDASVVKASAALAEFVRSPKTLNISLKGKNGPVNFQELQALRDPMAALQKIDLTVTANR